MKVDAYIRVSQVRGRSGETFISPQVQEERIRAWAAAHGHEVIAAYRELDVSGGSMDRPLMNEVMARVDAGESEGIVVYRLDRFGRTLVGALELIERIRDRGALFASVSDSFDITTETGRLVLNIMLSIAQYERERIAINWREARARAVARGVHISAYRPFGYQRHNGRLERDDQEAPIVAEVFRRCAAGEPHSRIRNWVNESGVRTSHGNAWTSHRIRQLVSNRVYLGEAAGSLDGEPLQDAHPPLTDPATFEAAQIRRGARAAPASDIPVVSRGLVRCAACRYIVDTKPSRTDGKLTSWHFRCSRHQKAGDCPEPITVTAVSTNGAPGLDDVIVAEMFRRLELVEFEAVDSTENLDGLEGDWQRAEAAYNEVLTDTELEQEIGKRAFRARLTAFAAVRDEKRAILDDALRRAGRSSIARPVRELREEWPGLTTEEQRWHLVNTIQAVFVRPGERRLARGKRTALGDQNRVERLLEQVHIVWATEPPVDVPRQGRRDWTPKPFEFPDANPGDVRMALP